MTTTQLAPASAFSFDLGAINSWTDIRASIEKINAAKPLIKLMEDVANKKRQLFYIEIELARQAVIQFPLELRAIYTTTNRINAAKFWASKTDSEILEFIGETESVDFYYSWKAHVIATNEGKIKAMERQVRGKTGIIEIDDDTAKEIAISRLGTLIGSDAIQKAQGAAYALIEDAKAEASVEAERVKAEIVDMAEWNAKREAEKIIQDAKKRARVEAKPAYDAAKKKIMSALPTNIKGIKAEIKRLIDEALIKKPGYEEYETWVDVHKVIDEAIRIEWDLPDPEYFNLFYQYATSYIRQNYDVCLGQGSQNRTIYYLWKSATTAQRNADVQNKIESVLADLGKLAKRENVTDYMGNRIAYETEWATLFRLIKYIQEERGKNGV